jgi:hypothetical protein
MFSRFSGISAADYQRRMGRRPWLGAGTPAAPKLGQTMAKPLCLCDLQRKADQGKSGPSASDRARRSM